MEQGVEQIEPEQPAPELPKLELSAENFLSGLTANYGGGEKTRYYSFLVYGRMGAGKTSAIVRTAPRKTLIISLDPGGVRGYAEQIANPEVHELYVYDKAERDDPKNPTALATLMVLLDHLYETELDRAFGCIALDSLSSLEQIAMAAVLSADKKADFTPGQQHYNPMMKRVDYVLRQLLRLRTHIILTAHADVFRNPALQIAEVTVSLTGRNKDRIPLLFDEIYSTEIDPNGKYVFRCASAGDVNVRSRIAASRKLPALLPANFCSILNAAGVAVKTPKPVV